MWRYNGLGEGAIGVFVLGFSAFLTFGCVSCQNKGSGPSSDDWQAMYEALSEEEQAKLGNGLKSVATSGLTEETIAGSAFDSTYAIDTSGEEPLFYVIVEVDTTGDTGALEKFGSELEPLPWDRTRFSLKATGAKVMSLAKVTEVVKLEAETDWQRALRTLSEEERKKLGSVIRLIGILNFTKKELVGSFFAERWAIDTRGEEPIFGIHITTNGGSSYSASVTFLGIIEIAKREDVIRIELGLKFHLVTATP